jgi:hypothetical protein
MCRMISVVVGITDEFRSFFRRWKYARFVFIILLTGLCSAVTLAVAKKVRLSDI